MHGAANPNFREIEIKLLLKRQDVARLKRHPLLWAAFEKAGEPARQDSVYFDDRRQTLRREGLTLRVRHIGERRIQTIKAVDGHTIDRGEWKTEIAGNRPELSAAAGTALAPVLAKLSHSLEPMFETRVSRIEFPLQYGNSEIVVALDEGEIDTGEAKAPISEFELELKQGKARDLFRLAQQINATIPLELSYVTKSLRGYALLDASALDAVKAGGVGLKAGMARAQAFRIIAHDCLRHMAENRAGVARGETDALHQVRIAIRRLRTTMTLFRDVVSGEGAQTLRTQLRWLRDLTGPARDLDVFLGEVVAPLRARLPKDRALGRFHRHVKQRRTAAYRAARAAILSAQFRSFVLQTAGWVEDGDWRSEADALTRTRQDAPVELHAGTQLSVLHKKVRKHGKDLRNVDDEARHRLRIHAKKLRYACEFFAGLAASKKARKRANELIASLRQLQDKLGGLNDIAVRQSLSAELAGEIAPRKGDRQSRQDREAIQALIAGHQNANIDRLLDEAAEAYAAFRKVKPFWKVKARKSVAPVPAVKTKAAASAAVPEEPQRQAA
jgi:triphosphatase